MEIDELYSDFILELYRHPLNKGKMEGMDFSYSDVNPTCGDMIEIGILVEHGKIAGVVFDGQGCAISQAAASVLTERVKGKRIDEALKFRLHDLLHELHLSHLKENPARIKCAALPLKVLKMALFKHLGERKEVKWNEIVE